MRAWGRSNLLWGFAKLEHHPGDALIEAADSHTLQMLLQFSTQAVVSAVGRHNACSAGMGALGAAGSARSYTLTERCLL